MSDIVEWLRDKWFAGPMQHFRDWSEIDARHKEAAAEIEHLRLSLSEALAQRDAAFEMSKCECGTDEACRNLAKMQSDYERLARHIAPDVDAEYIWSHLPEQIIDAGLQLQASALSKARATGRREGLSEAAKIAAEHAEYIEGVGKKHPDDSPSRDRCFARARSCLAIAAPERSAWAPSQNGFSRAAVKGCGSAWRWRRPSEYPCSFSRRQRSNQPGRCPAPIFPRALDEIRPADRS